jgi:hypothetical protein
MPPCQGPHGSDGRRVGEAGDPGTLYIRYYTFYQQSRINDQISQKPPAQRGLACRYPESGSHGSACSPLSSRGWEVLYFVWYCIPMGAVGVADHPHANPKIILKTSTARLFPWKKQIPRVYLSGPLLQMPILPPIQISSSSLVHACFSCCFSCLLHQLPRLY